MKPTKKPRVDTKDWRHAFQWILARSSREIPGEFWVDFRLTLRRYQSEYERKFIEVKRGK